MRFLSLFIASLVFSSVCFFILGVAVASAPYEAAITGLNVTYANYSEIGVVCKNDDCVLRVKVRGKWYSFDSNDLRGQVVLDSLDRPVLFSMDNTPGSFSFEIGLDCEAENYPRSEGLACYANYLVLDGKINKIRRFTRGSVVGDKDS